MSKLKQGTRRQLPGRLYAARGLNSPASRAAVRGCGPARCVGALGSMLMLLQVALLPVHAGAVTATPAAGDDAPVGVCSRTRQVREALVAKVQKVRPTDTCHDVTAAELAAISGDLDLSEQDIATLQPGDFADLGSLELLDLNSNKLSMLVAGVFSGLENLKRLKLNLNELETLETGVFSDLGSLENLSLGGNHLGNLDVELFSGLGKLQGLFLYDNRLGNLEAGLFSGLNDLKTLFLVGNNLGTLDVELFSGLGSLEILNLRRNGLLRLDAGVFSGLGSLKTLELDQNNLGRLEADVFSGLDGLESLLLHYNDLSELEPNVFSGLDSLRYLSLNGNHLSELETGVFSELDALEKLFLSDNRLARLEADVFSGLHNLQKLNVSGNPFLARIGLPTGIFDDVVDTLGMIGTVMDWWYAADFAIDSQVRAGHFVCGRSDAAAIVAATDGVNDCLRVTSAQFARYAMSHATTDLCERTQQVQSVLLARMRETRAGAVCGDVTVGELRTLGGELDLSDSGITRLRAGDFEHLTSITRIDLSGNAGLTSLPDGILDDVLSTLTRLNLDENLKGEVSFAAGAGSMIRGAPTKTIAVVLSRAMSMPVSVAYSTSYDGTPAPADADGLPTGTGRLLFPAGVRTRTLRVNAVASVPPGGTVVLTLEQPSLPTDARRGGGLEASSLVSVNATSSSHSLTVIAPRVVNVCTRTAEVAAAIVEAIRQTRPAAGCADVTDAELAGITGPLDFGNRGLTTLQAGDFAGLHSLRGLLLHDNDLGALGVGVFTGLDGLEYLGLSRTNLDTLEADTFTGLDGLLALDLSGNGLGRIKADVFSRLDGLLALDLSRNGLSGIKADAFTGLDNLSILDLGDNNLGRPLLYAIPGQGRLLEYLRLDDNDFGPEETDALAGLGNLKYLTLDGNFISRLQAEAFAGLGGLHGLDLSRNALSQLQAEALSGLGHLEFLSLEDNSLGQLETDAFAGLGSLKELYLGGNNLGRLGANVFSGLRSLEFLSLRDSSLARLEADAFAGLHSLRRLLLHDNENLGVLPTGIFDEVLDTLTELGLDTTLRGTVCFAANSISMEQGGMATLGVQLDRALPVSVRIPILGPEGSGVSGMVLFPAGTGGAVVTMDARLTASTRAVPGENALMLGPPEPVWTSDTATPIRRTPDAPVERAVVKALLRVSTDRATAIVTAP